MVRKKIAIVLGRYDATHHTIFVGRLFDAPTIPAYVIEYVMFHEMLHVKHQTRVRDSRIIVHTPEFKIEERNFPHTRKRSSGSRKCEGYVPQLNAG